MDREQQDNEGDAHQQPREAWRKNRGRGPRGPRGGGGEGGERGRGRGTGGGRGRDFSSGRGRSHFQRREPTKQRVAVVCLAATAVATQLVEAYHRHTGKGDSHLCLVAIQSQEIEAFLNDNSTQALKELIPAEHLGEDSRGVNQDFEKGFLRFFAETLRDLMQSQDLCLLSGVEPATPPKYPNCDLLGCLSFGHMEPRDNSIYHAARREILEEAGILLPVECFNVETLPFGLPRRMEYDQGFYHGKKTKLVFLTVKLPASLSIGDKEAIGDEETALDLSVDQKYHGREFLRLSFPRNRQ